MSRYIEVNDVANAIYHHFPSISTMADARGIIEEAPSIDIVRCKECRWGKPYSDKQLECDALGLGGLKFPNDFCSYGVKKGADDE